MCRRRRTYDGVSRSTVIVPSTTWWYLRKAFLIGLETIVNFRTKQLVLTGQHQHEEIHPTEPSNVILIENLETQNLAENSQSGNFQITLQPRSETIISIPTPDIQEEKNLHDTRTNVGGINFMQQYGESVRQKQILIAAVNPTEHFVHLTKKQIKGSK